MSRRAGWAGAGERSGRRGHCRAGRRRSTGTCGPAVRATGRPRARPAARPVRQAPALVREGLLQEVVDVLRPPARPLRRRLLVADHRRALRAPQRWCRTGDGDDVDALDPPRPLQGLARREEATRRVRVQVDEDGQVLALEVDARVGVRQRRRRLPGRRAEGRRHPQLAVVGAPDDGAGVRVQQAGRVDLPVDAVARGAGPDPGGRSRRLVFRRRPRGQGDVRPADLLQDLLPASGGDRVRQVVAEAVELEQLVGVPALPVRIRLDGLQVLTLAQPGEHIAQNDTQAALGGLVGPPLKHAPGELGDGGRMPVQQDAREPAGPEALGRLRPQRQGGELDGEEVAVRPGDRRADGGRPVAAHPQPLGHPVQAPRRRRGAREPRRGDGDGRRHCNRRGRIGRGPARSGPAGGQQVAGGRDDLVPVDELDP